MSAPKPPGAETRRLLATIEACRTAFAALARLKGAPAELAVACRWLERLSRADVDPDADEGGGGD